MFIRPHLGDRQVKYPMKLSDYQTGPKKWPKRIELGGEKSDAKFESYLKQVKQLLREDPNMRACLEQVKALDKDEKAYDAMVRVPFLHGA